MTHSTQSKVKAGAAMVKDETANLAKTATETAKSEAHARSEAAREAAAAEAETATEAAQAASDVYPDGSLHKHAGEQVAQGLDATAKALREVDIDAMSRDAAAFARRNPVLFLGGAAAAGFAVARFLKASDPAPRRTADTGPDPWRGHLDVSGPEVPEPMRHPTPEQGPRDMRDTDHRSVLSKINGEAKA